MKKKTLLLDLDNVISDTDMVVRSLIERILGIDAKKEEIVDFNYYDSLGYKKEKEKSIWDEFHKSACANVTPIVMAKDAIKRLSIIFNIKIVTSRDVISKKNTLKWLKDHKIPFDELIFIKTQSNNNSKKLNVINENKGSLLVEDCGETALEIAKSGSEVILFDNPWNRNYQHRNIIRKKSWKSIYSYILSKGYYLDSFLELHKDLNNKAMRALENSYSPYSHFKVGAALMTTDGAVFTGCNIENVAFTPTICAERTAIFKAISSGYRRGELFSLSTISINSNGILIEASPCGVCRQVILEFSDFNFPVHISIYDKKRGVSLSSINKLAPSPFVEF